MLLSVKNEGYPPIYDNMNEPGVYYAKWNKPATEGQILHSYNYIRFLRDQTHRNRG